MRQVSARGGLVEMQEWQAGRQRSAGGARELAPTPLHPPTAPPQFYNSLISLLREQPWSLDPAAQVQAQYVVRRWGRDVLEDSMWWSPPTNEAQGHFDEGGLMWRRVGERGGERGE